MYCSWSAEAWSDVLPEDLICHCVVDRDQTPPIGVVHPAGIYCAISLLLSLMLSHRSLVSEEVRWKTTRSLCWEPNPFVVFPRAHGFKSS
jgi:hypothetical protein